MTNGKWESVAQRYSKTNKELLEQWDTEKNLPKTPYNVGVSSKSKIWWKCPLGHSWGAIVQSRVRGSGCPICSNKKVLAGYNDLATTHPEIASQWDHEKNTDLKPTEVTFGSHRNVWWICPRGHSYDAQISERSTGNGCPYCIGKRPILGETDLASQYPRLAAEWHPTKNGNRRPEEYTVGSSKKVWWLCDKGHDWQAVIYSRVDGNNCPYCGNQKLWPGFNDLATTHPDWARQWHPTKNGNIRPDMVFGSTGKKYWWVCENGHEWDSSPNNRSKVPGCPICSRHRYAEGYTDLETVYPELAKEWHPTKNGDLLPSQVHFGSQRRVWWKCEKGHEWQAVIGNRARGGNACPMCVGRVVAKGETDLATVNPSLAAEWHPTKNGDLAPSDVKPHSPIKVWWMCDKGHEWEATVNDRSNLRGCPFCYAGTQTSFNEKAVFVCLRKTFPDMNIEPNYEGFRKKGIYDLDIYIPQINLGIEYDGPRHTNPQREIKKNDRCQNMGIELLRIKEHLRNIDESLFPEPFVWISDHASAKELDAVIVKLEEIIASKAGIGDYESHAHVSQYRAEINELVIIVPKKSLASSRPDVAKEWHPTKNGSLTPDQVYAGSNRYAWWMCPKGHEWEAVISSRQKNGCPFCSNRRIIPGENDLATSNPELIKEWHPTKNGNLTPYNVSPGSSKSVWWICDKKHEWKTTIVSRSNGRGCPYCRGRITFTGYNDLATKFPEIAKEWHPTRNNGIKPSEVAGTSIRKAWWKCKNGHEWEAQINSRTSMRCGCPYCSGKRITPGVNDLATKRPDLVKEWHPAKNGDLKPEDLSPESHRSVWWQCARGHEWQKQPHGRGTCPVCSGRTLLTGFNDLKTVYPQVAQQFDVERNGKDPSQVLQISRKVFTWKCEKGHRSRSTITDKVKKGADCVECLKQTLTLDDFIRE